MPAHRVRCCKNNTRIGSGRLLGLARPPVQSLPPNAVAEQRARDESRRARIARHRIHSVGN
ncbi:hypothetical protein CERZMDRAFT_110472 [Cercospora zeae-maydis SCOH1-5]|uniref:Uncharacterized protein n=1 Tax=Cercospora zeae-maydis SCOH1-5 TaxID=717836 RepID=A0A6A6FNB6_9PEZI|nr:hypothetical protein CERZMDRAFT_110472 [Cercospora zeae-maydis SCOH1-5]